MRPRPHPLARSRFAALADRTMALSWLGPNKRPPLDPDFLWRKGSAGFAAEDEGAARDPEDVADFRERLTVLCESLNAEARLNALGHAMAYGQLKAAVRTRQALGRMWRENPDLPATDIAPPIIVVGQMRSGTTRVHRLLAADPRHTATRMCNAVEPVPRSPDTRPLRCAAGLALARQINPWLDTLHPFGATRPDEELGWLSWSLSPCAFEAQWRIPSFVAFSETRDLAPVYRELARILRSDAALMRDGPRSRVLKCPQYAEDLAALLALFPDARLVVARRDENDVLSSTVSVVASQLAYQTDHGSLADITAEWGRKIALREERMRRALTNFQGLVAEVEFADLTTDWESAIRAIYGALDLDLTEAALVAMRREQDRSATAHHTRHREQIHKFETA